MKETSLAQAISGCTVGCFPKVANPQSEPACTLSLPTMVENSLSRLATCTQGGREGGLQLTSAGCSMKFVVESMTPGTRTLGRARRQEKTDLVLGDRVLQLPEDVHLRKNEGDRLECQSSRILRKHCSRGCLTSWACLGLADSKRRTLGRADITT